MWPPPNIQFLPSTKEIKKAKEEISTIEQEIIETELRLDALRKSLLERKAWIAPIRTIPPEIISLIFIEASTADWKAPLVLQSVCRRWRDVIVDSPEAWTFIPLSRCISERRSELISLFVEHSRNTPLHVSAGNDSLLGYMKLLANRIKCIHLDLPDSLLDRYLHRGQAFHRLEILRIGGWNWRSEFALPTGAPETWDMLLFPNLKVLEISTVSPSLLRKISAAPEFPAIRYLRVTFTHIRGLHDILTKCATSLEAVHLDYRNLSSGGLDMEYEVNFPRLRFLRLSEFSDEAGARFRFQAVTPNLQVYGTTGNFASLNATKVDTDSVILLHTVPTPNLSRYPRLVTLCLGRGDRQQEEVTEVVECLRDKPTLCPDLALIEYIGKMTQELLVKAKNALLARGRVTGQEIQLVEGTLEIWAERAEMLGKVPGCGDHMPCNALYDA